MRPPRIRLTIGRLMIVVLLVGVALWGGLIVRPRYIKQGFAEHQAEARYHQAKLVREGAEYAVNVYTEDRYQREVAVYLGQSSLARSDLERAIERLERSDQMLERSLIDARSRNADRLAIEQANFDLDQARTQLAVLKNYTRQKTLKSLRNDVAKAKAVELNKLAAYRMIRDKRVWLMMGF